MVEFLFATCIGKKNAMANVINDKTKIIMINIYNNPSCVANCTGIEEKEGGEWVVKLLTSLDVVSQCLIFTFLNLICV